MVNSRSKKDLISAEVADNLDDNINCKLKKITFARF